MSCLQSAFLLFIIQKSSFLTLPEFLCLLNQISVYQPQSCNHPQGCNQKDLMQFDLPLPSPVSVILPHSFHCKHMFPFTLQRSLEKNTNRQQVNISKGTSVKMNRAPSAYYYERSYPPISPVAPGPTSTSRSEPDLALQYSVPKRSVPMQRFLSNKVIHRTERASSQFISSRSQPPSNTVDKSPIKTQTPVIYTQTDSSKQFSKPAVVDDAVKGKEDSG